MDTLLNTKLLTYDIRVRKTVSNRVRWYSYKDTEVLGVIITNLISCLRKGTALVYSRNKNYKLGLSKKCITVARVIRGVDFLVQEGMIVNHLGVASSDSEFRKISWIEPTKKFVDEWCEEEIRVLTEQDYLDTCSVVELRDSDKNAVPYKNSEHIKRMADTVRSLNRMNEKHTIRDGKGKILTNIYCRIFNESFEYGGRFYRADVLAIKNKDNDARLDITIDHKRVVEVDFSNLHFRIAATMEDLDMEDIPLDVYSGILEDETNTVDRRIVKLAVNMMFNCKDEGTAQKSIQKSINMLSDQDKSVYSLGTAKSVMMLIYSAYPTFSHKFCAAESFGRVLQNADSHLASDILEAMIDKGIPCLPVHDSFIVPIEHMDFLCDTMGDCFRKRFGYDGVVPVGVKWKNESSVVTEEKICV